MMASSQLLSFELSKSQRIAKRYTTSSRYFIDFASQMEGGFKKNIALPSSLKNLLRVAVSMVTAMADWWWVYSVIIIAAMADWRWGWIKPH